MSDIDRELRERFRDLDLPEAPATLRIALAEVVDRPSVSHRVSRRPFLLLGLVAVLAAGGAVVASGSILLSSAPTREFAEARPSASPQPSPSPAPTASPLFPLTVAGLPAHTVSDLLSARAAGTLPTGSLALVGYWSSSRWAHVCTLLDGNPGELELWCDRGESGITERDEPTWTMPDIHGRRTPAAGPTIVPYLAEDLAGASDLYTVAPVHGQVMPVPIAVIGHFDDPRADDCREQARQQCRDRFVIERIVSFDLDRATVPAITPSPSPFPFESPPPLGLDLDMCAEATGTSDFSFVGWMSEDELAPQLASGARFRDGVMLAVAITKEAVLLADRRDLGADGYRVMGRSICIVEEGDLAATRFDALKGSIYRLYDDGREEPTDSPLS
jgi:hypothetical protein